jgi:hypothetical protein
MKRTAITRPKPQPGILRTASLKAGKPMKSRGMKGRAPTAAERALHHDMAGLGCIACLLDGRVNPWVSIHHIDGRTKPGAHKKVLALCAQHHQQDDTDPLGRIAVHPNKARFEALYGSQESLLAMTMERLGK